MPRSRPVFHFPRSALTRWGMVLIAALVIALLGALKSEAKEPILDLSRIDDAATPLTTAPTPPTPRRAIPARRIGKTDQTADARPREWRPFLGVSVASKHFGAERNFQEFNPGASVGVRSDLGWRRGEWGVEAGYFQNSYDEGSAYVGLWADWPVLMLTEDMELRLGAFFAYAEYPQLVDEAEDFGALTIGDFVPLLAAQASLRLDDRYAVTARFGPGISDSDLIVGLQAMYLF